MNAHIERDNFIREINFEKVRTSELYEEEKLIDVATQRNCEYN